MTTSYRIVGIESGQSADPVTTTARSPEDAVKRALGLDLVRSGRKAELMAQVYFQHPGQPLSMVRLYRRTEQ